MNFILVKAGHPDRNLSVRGVVSPSGQATCEKSQLGSPSDHECLYGKKGLVRVMNSAASSSRMVSSAIKGGPTDIVRRA